MNEWLAVWTLIRKDVSVWLRQPSAITATLLPPLLFIPVLYVAASAVGRNPVAVVAGDSGPRAQQLIRILDNSDAFLPRLATASEAQRELNDLDVSAVITIPPDFDQRYLAHQADPVTIQINNLNLDFTNDLRRSLPMAITEFYAAQPDDPIDVRMKETDLRPQDVGLVQFQMVPTLVLLLTIAGVVNSGLATAREWEDHTIKMLLLAPLSRASLIVGKLLAGWLTTLAIAGVVLAIGAATGYLRPSGVFWLTTLLTIGLVALASAGIGVAVGASLKRFRRVTAATIPLSFYLFFLSGGIGAIAFLPKWVQTVAYFVPTYYGVHALQMSIFYGSTDGLARDLAVLIGTSVVAVFLGVWSLGKNAVA